jgi:hypothetical protein
VNASQRITPGVQSLFKPIINTPGGILKSWC